MSPKNPNEHESELDKHFKELIKAAKKQDKLIQELVKEVRSLSNKIFFEEVELVDSEEWIQDHREKKDGN